MKKGRAEITLLRPTLKVVFDVVNFSALCFVCICYYEVRCFLDLFFGLTWALSQLFLLGKMPSHCFLLVFI